MSINLVNATSIIGRTIANTVEIDAPTTLGILSGPPSGVIKVQSLNVYSLLLQRTGNGDPATRTFVDFIVNGARLNSELANVFSNNSQFDRTNSNMGSTLHVKSENTIIELDQGMELAFSPKLKFSFVNKNEPIYLAQGQSMSITLRSRDYAFPSMEISYSCTYEEITL